MQSGLKKVLCRVGPWLYEKYSHYTRGSHSAYIVTRNGSSVLRPPVKPLKGPIFFHKHFRVEGVRMTISWPSFIKKYWYLRKKLKKKTFWKNRSSAYLDPYISQKKNFYSKKNYLGDYLIVGPHEYHNENQNGRFRFFWSVDSYRNRHLKLENNVLNFEANERFKIDFEIK